MTWSAKSLTEGFAKSIIGFDLRALPLICKHAPGGSLMSFPPGATGKNRFPATIDNQIWPQRIEISSVQFNGFNLFDQPTDELRDIAKRMEAVLVAFDLPKALADILSSTFGLAPLPTNVMTADKSWKFLGYDIVDIRTQSSAIYSFEWSNTELREILQQLSLQLNPCGLIENELSAVMHSISFDDIVPEHFPFSPCGVWIQGWLDLDTN